MKFPRLTLPKCPPREPDPPGVATATMQFWFFIAVWAFALLGSLWMLVVFIAGSVGRIDWQTSYVATEKAVTKNTSLFALDVHWSVGVGLFLFCAAIAIYNAVWLEMRRHTPSGLMRNILTGIGCAVACFMVSGATVVQQRGTDARVRDDVIAAQSAQAGAAGIQGQIGAIDARLAQMRDRSKNNEYAATAANVGEKAYRQSYMSDEALARSPRERRDIIARAVGAAQAADALEADRARLTALLATASVTVVQEQARSVKADSAMGTVANVLEDARKPVTAILGELLAMTVLSAALAAWASRRAALEGAQPMASALAIEDHSAEAPLEVDPAGLRPPEKRERVWDDAEQCWKYKRRETYAKPPARRGKRKDDKTDYEPAVASPTDPRSTSFDAGAGDGVELRDENVAEEAALEGANGVVSGLTEKLSVRSADGKTVPEVVSGIGLSGHEADDPINAPPLPQAQAGIPEAGGASEPEAGQADEISPVRSESGLHGPGEPASEQAGETAGIVSEPKALEPAVYDALAERQLIQDGEIPDDMPTETVEEVAGWMADKRGLPAPEREVA